MINSDDFRKVCGAFDSAKCAAMLNGLAVADAARVIEEHVRQSGCLIQPRIKPENVNLREQFIAYCRADFASVSHPLKPLPERFKFYVVFNQIWTFSH